MGPEVKLYKKLKNVTPQIIWNRIENTSIPGMPDLLGYNTSGTFFTVELKVTKSKKIRFSPHQIAWHVQHPKNSFILAEPVVRKPRIVFKCSVVHGSWSLTLAAWSLKLVAWGLTLAAWSFNGLVLDACCLKLSSLSSHLCVIFRMVIGHLVWSPGPMIGSRVHNL